MADITIAGVMRAGAYSPNHIGNDTAIFNLVAEQLRKRGCQVNVYSEEQFNNSDIEEPVVLAMCRERASIAKLQKLSPKFNGIEVMTMKMRYPQGGEKQLIDAVMQRQVGSGALPISVGAVVQNVGTALAVYDMVQKNKPLIDNTVTVTGECFPHQANLLVRVGTPLRSILEHLGGIPEEAVKVIEEFYKRFSVKPNLGL